MIKINFIKKILDYVFPNKNMEDIKSLKEDRNTFLYNKKEQNIYFLKYQDKKVKNLV